MKTLSKAYARFSAPSSDLDQGANTLYAVHKARAPAREARETNKLADNFMVAAQIYQVAIRTACAKNGHDSERVNTYYEARKVLPGTSDDLVRAELALIQDNPKSLLLLDQMVEAGTTFMRTQPALALTLDLPLPEKLWNRVKLGFGA